MYYHSKKHKHYIPLRLFSVYLGKVFHWPIYSDAPNIIWKMFCAKTNRVVVTELWKTWCQIFWLYTNWLSALKGFGGIPAFFFHIFLCKICWPFFTFTSLWITFYSFLFLESKLICVFTGYQKVSVCMNRCAELMQRSTSNDAETALEVIAEALTLSSFSEKLLEMKANALFLVCGSFCDTEKF